MRIGITGDIDEKSGLMQVIIDWSGPAKQYFSSKNYGVGLMGLFVVLMCQNAHLDLKQRVRFTKKDKTLYLDLMLNLNEMKRTTNLQTKKELVADRLLSEISRVLKKYAISDFDETRFTEDLKNWLQVANFNSTRQP